MGMLDGVSRAVSDAADAAQRAAEAAASQAARAAEGVSETASSVTDAATDAAQGAAQAVSQSFVHEQAFLTGMTAMKLGVADIGRGGLDSHAAARKEFPSVAEADKAYHAQSAALLNVNNWDSLSGFENAEFKLFDSNGNPVNRTTAQPGDFVRIDLPGPGGYDWVKIDNASVTDTKTELTVRPTYDPTKRPLTPNVTCHFFDSRATNTFAVERNGTGIVASVHGRNEYANTGTESGGMLLAARNRATAETAWGAQVEVGGTSVNGAQQHQWNVFTERLANIGVK